MMAHRPLRSTHSSAGWSGTSCERFAHHSNRSCRPTLMWATSQSTRFHRKTIPPCIGHMPSKSCLSRTPKWACRSLGTHTKRSMRSRTHKVWCVAPSLPFRILDARILWQTALMTICLWHKCVRYKRIRSILMRLGRAWLLTWHDQKSRIAGVEMWRRPTKG